MRALRSAFNLWHIEVGNKPSRVSSVSRLLVREIITGAFPPPVNYVASLLIDS